MPSRRRSLADDAPPGDLAGRLCAGDEAAFELFARRYIPALYRFASRRLGDRELTREVVQSTVCRVIDRLDSYRGEAPLFTWLCACCRNEIAAHFRRRERRPHEVGLDEAPGGERAVVAVALAAGPEERFLRLETAERVHLALDRLPPGYAQAIEWRYLEELSVPEIARRLAATYKATESLLSRARRAFRALYEELDEGIEGRESAAAVAEGAAP